MFPRFHQTTDADYKYVEMVNIWMFALQCPVDHLFGCVVFQWITLGHLVNVLSWNLFSIKMRTPTLCSN